MELNSINLKFAGMEIGKGIQLSKKTDGIIVAFASYFEDVQFLWQVVQVFH